MLSMKKLSTNELIGNKIKKLRKDAKLTQNQLAEELSIHPKHLSNIENGRKSITIALLDKLCNFFDEPHFFFFDFSEYEFTNDDVKSINIIVRLLKSTSEENRKNILQIINILTR